MPAARCQCCGSSSLAKAYRFVFGDIRMDLAVTGGGKTVSELVRKDDGRGELRVLPSESFLDAGNRVHMVDVQGKREAFMLMVVVKQHDGTITRVQKC